MKLAASTAALIALCLCLAAQARGAEVVQSFVGVQGVWWDDDAKPSDFEVGGNGRASLSPHISGVGAAYYGLEHSHLRGSGGFRVTATDVDNEDFSIGIGLQYHFSTDPGQRPQAWAPDVSIGFKPMKDRWPRLIGIVQGVVYPSESNALAVNAGLRWAL